MASKRTSLVGKIKTGRAVRRGSLTTEGKCQIGLGPIQDVLLTELDTHGCTMRGTAVGVTKSDPMQVWLGEIGPITGKLLWARKGSVGIEFDNPIGHETIERVRTYEPGPTVVAIGRRSQA